MKCGQLLITILRCFLLLVLILFILDQNQHSYMEDHRDFSPFFNANFAQSVYCAQNCNSTVSKTENFKINPNQFQNISMELPSEDKYIYYFNMFFSPKETAQSLKRRNQNLEMLNFQNSDEEPDDVFNRRKKKVADLINKQEEQLSILMRIKQEDEGKFFAIIEFIKIFCQLKEKLGGQRTDYYSSKTFCALKNSGEAQLIQLSKVVQKMYSNVMAQSKHTDYSSQTTDSNTSRVDEKISEFLIIPRFLISKQKINRLCRDQVLQRNFQFLVFHSCLGHYNNEANKKMPEEVQMVHVRELLRKKFGKEKFKKICSINHGSKFLKSYGKTYFDLYSKSLQYLRQLDIYIKKGKKYETIRKDLDKIPSDNNDESFGNSYYTQNESSNSIYNFKNMDQCLNKMENSQKGSQMKSQMRDELIEMVEIPISQMKRKGLRKLMSMPLVDQQQMEKPRGFSVRKSQTMETKTTQNIILIHPPSYFER